MIERDVGRESKGLMMLMIPCCSTVGRSGWGNCSVACGRVRSGGDPFFKMAVECSHVQPCYLAFSTLASPSILIVSV